MPNGSRFTVTPRLETVPALSGTVLPVGQVAPGPLGPDLRLNGSVQLVVPVRRYRKSLRVIAEPLFGDTVQLAVNCWSPMVRLGAAGAAGVPAFTAIDVGDQ